MAKKLNIDYTNYDTGRGMFYVYKLINPIDDSIFYVGRSANKDLKERLKQHMCLNNRNNPELVSVLEYILDAGYKPEIELIEASTYMHREIEIIKEYAKRHPLRNIINGNMVSR
jgi:hypothetical protein